VPVLIKRLKGQRGGGRDLSSNQSTFKRTQILAPGTIHVFRKKYADVNIHHMTYAGQRSINSAQGCELRDADD
jgi:hypothetical protein